MLKSYKYRLYPTKDQKEFLSETFGCCRLVYNLALETKIEAYRKGVIFSCYDLMKQITDLKKDYKWLGRVNTTALQQSILNLKKAYDSFFRGNGFPKFKSRYNKQSFRVIQNLYADFKKSTIKIPKMKPIKCVYDRTFEGKIKNITISKTPTGKYFASILVDNGVVLPDKMPVRNAIGIDLGLNHFVITSDGIKIDNPRFLKESLQRLKVLQRRASRKKKGSKNRKKSNLRVAIKHEKISNKRLDYLHQVSSRLVNDSQVDTFFVEDLNVKGMVANHCLAQSISDVSWSKFLEFMRYKCEWKGKNLIEINRFDPSSKKCCKCGNVKTHLALSERAYNCSNCGIVIDRDINAAINIKQLGLKDLSGQGVPVEPVELPSL